MGSFTRPCSCCDTEGNDYIQAYICGTGVPADLWFRRWSDGRILTDFSAGQTLPYYFEKGGVCYYVVNGNNTSDTPGTMAATYTESDPQRCCCTDDDPVWTFTWNVFYNCVTEEFEPVTQVSRELTDGSGATDGWVKISGSDTGCTFKLVITTRCDDGTGPPDWPPDPEPPEDPNCCGEPPHDCVTFCGVIVCPKCPVLMEWDLTKTPAATGCPEEDSGSALLEQSAGGPLWLWTDADARSFQLECFDGEPWGYALAKHSLPQICQGSGYTAAPISWPSTVTINPDGGNQTGTITITPLC
jgi:hypothetical protein